MCVACWIIKATHHTHTHTHIHTHTHTHTHTPHTHTHTHPHTHTPHTQHTHHTHTHHTTHTHTHTTHTHTTQTHTHTTHTHTTQTHTHTTHTHTYHTHTYHTNTHTHTHHTHRHSEYVIFIAFPLQQLLYERVSMLRYIHGLSSSFPTSLCVKSYVIWVYQELPTPCLIIFINCIWVVTRWQWLFYTYTKYVSLLVSRNGEALSSAREREVWQRLGVQNTKYVSGTWNTEMLWT